MTRTVSVKTIRFSMNRFLSATALTAVGLMALAAPAEANDNPWSNFDDQAGSISIDTSNAGHTMIDQHTQTYIGNSNNLDILQGQSVTIGQNNTGSLFVGRATNKGSDPTRILGNLNTRLKDGNGSFTDAKGGTVMVLDRNGVIFGADSRVDVGGIIASTGDVSNEDILDNDGQYTFSNFGDGKIEMKGTISVANAGLAAFVSPYISNSGEINAKMGKVVLASGEKVTLDLYGDDLIEVAVDGELSDALIENSGTINAQGGTVIVKAEAAKEIVNNVINMGGVVNASSASMKGGKIVLDGGSNGTVKVTGKLDASGGTGGGEIAVTGKNVYVSNEAVLAADAGTHGNGGTVNVIADEHADFRGAIYARGGSESGNGGNAEVSGYKVLGYQGYTDLSATNGASGTLLLDPEFVVIHNGILNDPLGGGYVISAQALANSMRNNTVRIEADDFIDVGTKPGGYNIDTGNFILSALVNAGLNALADGNINLSTYDYYTTGVIGSIFGFPIYGPVHQYGTTNGGLELASTEVNFNRNLTMGNGNLLVDADMINLNSKLFEKNSATLLGDARLSSNAGTVNVSAAALIQQGVWLADDAGGATVNVAAGTYNENIIINKSLTLQSDDGRDTTIINGIAGVNALGTVVITPNVNDVYLGKTNKGFTINGFDNGNPGIENAAVYLQGAHDNVAIQGNRITAKGEAALTTEWTALNNDLTIDDNIFDGKTFEGAAWATTGDQFTIPNRPRQLIALGTQTSNLVFTNNTVGGNSGSNNVANLHSAGGLIEGNTFTGASDGASTLRVRGSNMLVKDNQFTAVNVNQTNLLIENTTGATVTGNTTNGGYTGIRATGSNGVVISKNAVSGTSNDGIAVYNSANAVIGGAVDTDGNTVENVQGNGIYTNNTDGVVIARNTVTDSILNNIWADNSDNVTINNNVTSGTAAHAGIALRNVTGANIFENAVTNAGYGLYADGNTTGVKAHNNSVTNITNYLVWNNGAPGIYNASGNWWGGVSEAAIAAQMAGTIDFSSYLANGTDTSPAKGFQGDFSEIYVTNLGSQVGTKGRIQEAVDLIVDGSLTGGARTVHVNNGTYAENVTLNKSLTLQSVNGRDQTTIDGIEGVGALGTVVITDGVTNVNLGTANKGFTINGFDSANPGIETAAVYLQGDHNKISIVDNRIVANGDSALAGEYGRTNRKVTVDGNIITGQTYTGAPGAWGTGNQFVDPNVPRQLVAFNKGFDTLTFTNNEVVGDSGDRQLVAIESAGANISGNSFEGLTTSALLHVRGSSITVADNTFDGNDKATTGIRAGNVDGLTIGGATDADGNTIANVKDGWSNSAINIKDGKNITVAHNTLTNNGGNGIYAEGTYGIADTQLDINNNKINGSEYNAMYIKFWNGADIASNQIDGTDYGHGIQLELNNNALIKNNTILNVADAGIHLWYGNDMTTIEGNTITDAKNGIVLSKEGGQANTNTMIGSFTSDPAKTNTIKGGQNGVLVNGGGNLWVQGNDIKDTSIAGVSVTDSAGAYNIINNNKINNTKDGIRVLNTKSVIADNRIGLDVGLTGNGIVVDTSNGTEVLSNQISNVAKTGIVINKGELITVSDNILKKIGNNGIRTEQVKGITIARNDLDTVSWSGIEVQGGTNADVVRNKLNKVNGNGIQVSGTNRANVERNSVHDIRLAGIVVNDARNVLVDKNTVYNVGMNGIQAKNNNFGLTVSNNYVGFTDAGVTPGAANNIKADGILIEQSKDAVVKGNKTTETAGYGIRVVGSNGAKIGGAAAEERNTVTKADLDGIKVSGGTGVVVENNKVDDAGRVGIYAESAIDLSIKGNDVNNTTYAIGSPYGGITTDWGSNISVSGNTVANSGHGVMMYLAGGTNKIDGNTINTVWADGINVNQVPNVEVSGNFIGLTGGVDNIKGNGITLKDSDGAVVKTNTISDVKGHGISAATSNGILIGGLASTDANDIKRTKGKGIVVSDSNDSNVIYNKLANIGTIGIDLIRGERVSAKENDLKAIGNQGIRTEQVKTLALDHNIFDNVSWSGIQIEGGSNADVTRNEMNNVRGNGIQVSGTNRVNVEDNIVHDIRLSGIVVNGARTALIDGNTVYKTGVDGIQGANNNNGLSVTNNYIGYTSIGGTSAGANNIGGDGIFLTKSNGAVIKGNYITDTKYDGPAAKGSGILVTNTNNAVIGGTAAGEANHVNNAGSDGIVIRADGGVADGNTIIGNFIDNVQRTGVYLSNTTNTTVHRNVINNAGITLPDNGIITAFGGSNVTITRNNIDGGAGHGVQMNGVGGINLIRNNDIDGVGKDGIKADNVADLRIVNNDIGQTGTIGSNGVSVSGSNGARINDNTINRTGNHGILLTGGTNLTVANNIIGLNAPAGNIGADGIHADNVGDIRIVENEVRRTVRDAIFANGTGTARINRNIIRNVGADGIEASGFTDARINRNRITNAGQDGIEVSGNTSASLNNNRINGSTINGIYASGSQNGTVILAGNRLEENTTGARFESGVIDLTGATNTIIGGTTGLVFDPGVGGGVPTALSLVSNGAPGYKGEVYGGTLGTTVFEGLTDPGDNFIILANGALFAPGNPTLIDARFAKFNGVSASEDLGNDFELEQDQLDEIENRIVHFNDDPTLGRFFYGYLDSVPVIIGVTVDQEDAMRYFEPVNLQLSSLNVTLNGLPQIPGAPQNFNAITPFAGGNAPATDPSSLNNIETAAGGDAEPTGQTLNSVETAAGDTQASCWGDAAGMMQGGQAVNVNYGASAEDMLSNAAGCQTGL